MIGLQVVDEIHPDCVEIEGVVYSKQLFRQWGRYGLPVGEKFMLESREPHGCIVIRTLNEKTK